MRVRTNWGRATSPESARRSPEEHSVRVSENMNANNALLAIGADAPQPECGRSGKGKKIVKVYGGCKCGAIRYSLASTPTEVVVCHCSDCRHVSGAHALAWVILPSAGFHLSEGSPTAYRSSSHVTRTFCGTCGTTLMYQHDDARHSIDVTIGSLDEPEAFQPTQGLAEEDKLSWASLM